MSDKKKKSEEKGSSEDDNDNKDNDRKSKSKVKRDSEDDNDNNQQEQQLMADKRKESEEKRNSKDKDNKDNYPERDMSDKKLKLDKKRDSKDKNDNNQQEQKLMADKRKESEEKLNSKDKDNKGNNPERDISDSDDDSDNNQQKQQVMANKRRESEGKRNSKDKDNKDNNSERDLSDRKLKLDKKRDSKDKNDNNQQEQKVMADKRKESEEKLNSKDKDNKGNNPERDISDSDDDSDNNQQEQQVMANKRKESKEKRNSKDKVNKDKNPERAMSYRKLMLENKRNSKDKNVNNQQEQKVMADKRKESEEKRNSKDKDNKDKNPERDISDSDDDSDNNQQEQQVMANKRKESKERRNSKDKDNKDKNPERAMSYRKLMFENKRNSKDKNVNNQQEQKVMADKRKESEEKRNSKDKDNKHNNPERDMSDRKLKLDKKRDSKDKNDNNQQEQKVMADKRKESEEKRNSQDKDNNTERDISDKKLDLKEKQNSELHNNKYQQEEQVMADNNKELKVNSNSKDDNDNIDNKQDRDISDSDDDSDNNQEEQQVMADKNKELKEKRYSSRSRESKKFIFGDSIVSGISYFGEEMGKKNILEEYPKSVPFFIVYTFFRTLLQGEEMLLIIYLTEEIKYTENTAMIIYHTKRFIGNIIPIVSAILADSIFGYFKTIICLTLISICACTLITLGSIHTLGLPVIKLTIISLGLHACATVSTPLYNAFSGDQFILPDQIKLLTKFHAIVFIVNNISELISKVTMPIMREDVHCLGEISCYPLAFGMSILYLCIAFVVFISGYSYYNFKTPHKKNMLFLVFKIITYAVYKKIKSTDKKKRKHWLNYARAKYGKHLVGDVKRLLRVLLFCIPLPIYWAVSEQQDSRWTLQGTHMDGMISNTKIKPDQMHIIGPLLLLFFIPFYEKYFYPFLHYIKMSTPLQHLIFGGVLTAIAILISGIIQFNIEDEYPELPSPGLSVLRIYNGLPLCDYTFTTNIPQHSNIQINGLDSITIANINVEYQEEFDWTLTTTSSVCPTDISGKFNLKSEKIISYLIKQNQNQLQVIEYLPELFISNKASYIHILTNIQINDDVIFKSIYTKHIFNLEQMQSAEIPPNKYIVYMNNNIIKHNLELKDGGTYALLIGQESFNYYTKLFILHNPYYVHILWQIPQYTLITIGDVMLDIHVMGLSYILAPNSMKAVVQAFFLITAAMGEGLIVTFQIMHFNESQAIQCLFYAFLMFANIMFFWWVAKHYKLEDELDEVDEEEALTEYTHI